MSLNFWKNTFYRAIRYPFFFARIIGRFRKIHDLGRGILTNLPNIFCLVIAKYYNLKEGSSTGHEMP